MTIDDLLTSLGLTIDATRLKELAQMGTVPGASKNVASLGAASRGMLPITFAVEAARNTQGGWGNAINKQNVEVNDNPFLGAWNGFKDPLTTLANVGNSVATFADGTVQSIVGRGNQEQMKEKQARKLYQSKYKMIFQPNKQGPKK